MAGRTLMARNKHGNPHAGPVEVYVSHRTALVDYATPILGCRSRAEDIVQDAFLRFNTAATEADPPITHPVAYLYRIVRNLALNWRRSQKDAARETSEPEILDAVAAQTPSPEEQALYRDELRVMMAALEDLPERTRRAFELHRLNGYTFQHVAETLGISVGLAHQLVRDALTFCASRLDDDD